MDILKAMMPRFEARNIKVVVGNNMHPEPKGGKLSSPVTGCDVMTVLFTSVVGYGINHAILHSTGKYLCFLDGVSISHFPIIFQSFKE